MSAYWLFVAFATVNIFRIHCQNPPAGQDVKTEDGSSFVDALFGFKPCFDESCENYGPTDLETKDPVSEAEKMENPRAHCMMLKQSSVKLFGEIENSYPGVSDIKYRVLEDIIEYMFSFTSLKLGNCQPNMMLVDLVILAANALKTQYAMEGGVECIYETSYEHKFGESVQSENATTIPCKTGSSGYATETSTICAEHTMEPEMQTSSTQEPTEEPYVSSSTMKETYDESYVPSSQQTEKPYMPDLTMKPIPMEPAKSCLDGMTERPCYPSDTVTEESSEEEIIAEEDAYEPEIPQVGSLRGIPGVNYPNYMEIPITSFTCADKKYIPGFYADLETGCQVFHVCYEHRRESFLCPVGTVFNQPILACDYWYSSNCSLAPHYYDVNEKSQLKEEKIDYEVEELLTQIAEHEKPEEQGSEPSDIESDLDKITPFFPVKAIVTEIKPQVPVMIEPTTPSVEEVASKVVDTMATTATKVISSTRQVIKSIPEPAKPVYKPVKLDFRPLFKKPMKITDMLKETVIPLVSAKLATVPLSKAAAVKATVPVAGLAAKKVATPFAVAKAKLATKVAAIPAIKVAAAAPVLAAEIAVAAPLTLKAKAAAVAVPAAKVAVAAPVLAKTKAAAIAVPAAKVAVAAPVVAKTKAAAIAVPAAKVAVAAPVVAKTKAAAIAVPAAKVAVAAPVIAKTKAAAIAVPAAKVAVAAPVIAKTKAAAVAVPAAKIAVAAPVIAKGKVAVPAFKTAAVKVAAKSTIPALKAKMIASAVPLAKTKVVPLMKAKVVKGAGTPFLKAKMLALPLAKSKLAGPLPIAKVKLAKAAAISPLTKKALALGYMKLLKAKKVALMG